MTTPLQVGNTDFVHKPQYLSEEDNVLRVDVRLLTVKSALSQYDKALKQGYPTHDDYPTKHPYYVTCWCMGLKNSKEKDKMAGMCLIVDYEQLVRKCDC